MRKRKHVRKNQSYYSYHGQVHNCNITTTPTILVDNGVQMGSICAGHCVIGTPEPYMLKEK